MPATYLPPRPEKRSPPPPNRREGEPSGAHREERPFGRKDAAGVAMRRNAHRVAARSGGDNSDHTRLSRRPRPTSMGHAASILGAAFGETLPRAAQIILAAAFAPRAAGSSAATSSCPWVIAPGMAVALFHSGEVSVKPPQNHARAQVEVAHVRLRRIIQHGGGTVDCRCLLRRGLAPTRLHPRTYMAMHFCPMRRITEYVAI